MAQVYFDATKDDYSVFVMNADTNELITTLPKMSCANCSSSSVRIIPINVPMPAYSVLWTGIDWVQCDPAPAGYANTTEMAQAMCVYFPAQVITLNFP
jgi:hypothetical protein